MAHRLTNKLTFGLVLALLLGVALVLVGCQNETPAAPTTVAQQPAATQACPTAAAAQPCPTAGACPACPAPSTVTQTVTGTTAACPFQAEWAGSPHADKTAEAFNHWNEDSPAEVPTGCAQCHSSPGFQDYVGADGSAVGVVDKAAPIGTVVDCAACHNNAVNAFNVIPFPSGITVTVNGPENRCLVCHQGRSSGPSLDAAITKAAPADDDTQVNSLGFTNIHYKVAAATMYGTVVKGGYEYPGKAYDVKFEHIAGLDTCVDCHDQHTLQVKVQGCFCHELKTAEDARNVRELGSLVDYDGDGNTDEGMYFEVQGMQETLLKSIQMYATEVTTGAIAYDEAAYPYFFYDKNANGAVDAGEPAFKGWTPRLLRAAYNYQMSIKDPGSYVHNGKYIIELLYDSTDSLNAKLKTPVDLGAMHRNDAGHFDASAEAFRHWDEEAAVEGGCVRCHEAAGLPQFLENGTTIAMPQSSSLQCSTCHNESAFPARYEVTEVTFPSGKTAALDNPDSNLCLECHQGRESTVSVNKAIGDLAPDTASDKLRFRNVHYFAAGATLFGNDAMGAYQYDGKEYLGQFKHVAAFDTCIECHDAHNLGVRADACAGCHAGAKELTDIRMTPTDFDGDGNTTEGIAGEIGTMQEALYAALQAYAKDKAGTPLVYDPARYPYFFADANGNNAIDEGEGQYPAWTPRLLRGAYNYQYTQKDPGTFAHNAKYIIQVLYDSIQDLGGDVSKMTRP